MRYDVICASQRANVSSLIAPLHIIEYRRQVLAIGRIEYILLINVLWWWKVLM